MTQFVTRHTAATRWHFGVKEALVTDTLTKTSGDATQSSDFSFRLISTGKEEAGSQSLDWLKPTPRPPGSFSQLHNGHHAVREQ